jgi:hypothetical protein
VDHDTSRQARADPSPAAAADASHPPAATTADHADAACPDGADAGWPGPDVLVRQLTDLGDDERLARIHGLVWWLAGQNDLQRQRYRNALVTAGYISRGDWRSMLAEAKREHAAKRRTSARSVQCPYVVRHGCLYLPGADGGEVLLARFTAEVIAEVTRDDGAEVTKTIRVKVSLPTGRAAEVDVPADRLHRAREWTARAVGAAAVITPMSRDEAHVATAAQYLGDYLWDSETVYAHTGWRADLDGGHRFLTASGALGAAGLDTSVSVDLGNDRLNNYALPDPTTVKAGELAGAVRASLDLLQVAPAKVSAVLLAAAYRAPLPLPPETSVFVVGPTGSLKTALSAVVCQHFGRRLDAKGLPAEWKSTANALEATAYELAGVLMVIDDYAPQAADDPRKLAAAADRVLRGAANASARGRMRPDGTLRPPKPPRAQVASTGEDVPPGESLRARLTIASLDAGTVNIALLSQAQQQGAAGVYELAMAGYVRWLAQRWDTTPGWVDALRHQIATRRGELAAAGGHLRLPEAIAGLLTGWRHWLDYALAVTAITADQARQVMAQVSDAMRDVAAEQAAYAAQMQVARVYLTALGAALTGGHAHLADQDTGRQPPAHPTTWGWEPYGGGEIEQWHPRGTCIGWVSRDGHVYLAPDAAYEVARTHAGKAALPLNTTKTTIHKRLAEGRHLASVDKDQHTVVRTIAGRRRRVLHLHPELITGSED